MEQDFQMKAKTIIISDMHKVKRIVLHFITLHIRLHFIVSEQYCQNCKHCQTSVYLAASNCSREIKYWNCPGALLL